jgi:hypothetical protein
MQHVYTPEEYTEIQKLYEELKDIEIDMSDFAKKKPKTQTIKHIMAYSKALDVKQLKSINQFEQILN